jgi:hypothetical protein
MGQKVNPVGLRLGINRTWDSRWYAGKTSYGSLLHEDMEIRKALLKELKQAAVSKIVIERPHKKCRVTIHSARPGVVIGMGTGPDPSGQGSAYSCIYVNTMNGATANPLLYNNSMYDCGSRVFDEWGAFIVAIPTTITNNAVYMLASPNEPYIAGGSVACSSLGGSHNLWYGNGTAPCSSNLTSSLSANPLYASTTLGSTSLIPQSGSPLFGAGVAFASLARDITGAPRANPPSIGAYDVATGVTVQKPAAPTNLTITVN